MRKLVCTECGKDYYTADTLTPISKMTPCESCGGRLKDFTNSEGEILKASLREDIKFFGCLKESADRAASKR